MNFNEFGCERLAIESVRRFNQRNISIAEYCSENFDFLNLVDMYYRSLEENAILIFMFICAVFPVLFMCIAAVADKYLATGMTDLAARFKLSPAVAAMTLIAFANGAPDILASLGAAGKAGGAFISVGSLGGGFIFSSTLVVSNVILNAKDQMIQLPKLSVIKELVFYFFAIVCICIFGFLRLAGYPFIIAYLIIYGCYVVATLIIEKKSKADKDHEERVKEGDNPKDLPLKEIPEDENDPRPEDDITIEEDDSQKDNQAENKEDAKEKKNDKAEDRVAIENLEDMDLAEEDDEEKQKTGFFGKVCEEMFGEENGLIENIVLGPLMLAGMFTNSYLANPFMGKYSKYIILGNSLIFMVKTLDLVEMNFLLLIIIGYSIAGFFLIMELIGISRKILDVIYEVISVFAAIGWISIFSGLVIDFISFLAFYFSINEIILSSLLLSAGNTVGDFFGNAAMAKQGEELMAFMASYAGQVFNNFIGFSASMAAATQVGTVDFDIFALDYGKDVPDPSTLPPPMGNYFIIVVLIFAVFCIILSLVYFSINKFRVGKGFTTLMTGVYGIFFVMSLGFAYFSRGV